MDEIALNVLESGNGNGEIRMRMECSEEVLRNRRRGF